jgi:quercetin dioxygenase-like cupin family protein
MLTIISPPPGSLGVDLAVQEHCRPPASEEDRGAGGSAEGPGWSDRAGLPVRYPGRTSGGAVPTRSAPGTLRRKDMGLIRHSERRVDSPAPGINRVTIVDRSTGAGALTTRIVTLDPGIEMVPHWHKVEEAMMVLEGEGKAILGDDVHDIKAGETLLGPAGIKHGFVNTGPGPLRVAVAFPAVEVEVFTD